MAAMSQMSDDARYEAVKSYVDSAENPEYFYMAMASAANQDAVDYLKGKYDAGSSKALDALSTIRNESVAPVLLEVADKNQEYIKRYVDIIDANVKNDNPYKCRCYYKALQLGEASKVVPIDKLSVVITMILAALILHEQFTPKSIIGCVLIAAGTLLMVL